jgi:CubicO group peptidase (beta-lactamase class C family)
MLRLKSLLLLLTVLVLGAAPRTMAQAPTPLVVGQPVDRELAPADEHTYTLDLPAGTFVHGVVDQHTVDVVVTVRDPQGAVVREFDGPARGPEPFTFDTESAGAYQVRVTPFRQASGAYTMRLLRTEPVATTPEGRVEQWLVATPDDAPGVVVGIIRGGEVAFAQARGRANLTHDIPFTPETPTNIGSTAKQFTGFALALLADRGALSLDDDVRDHIPELPDFGETVTLRHLLTHTTGYREFLNALALGGRRINDGDHIAQREIIELVQRQPRLQNAPGAEFNYNNTAFALAAVVVERVTGRSFPAWMSENVFAPLGMEHTTVRANPSVIVPNSSQPYVSAADGYCEVRDIAAAMGAGGIYTTVADLARWMGNLRTGQLGGTNVLRELTTPYVLTTGAPTGYGLGLMVDEHRGLRRFHHGGADIAHRSYFVYYPDLDAGYVVLSNHPALTNAFVEDVVEAFFGEHMTPVNAEPVPLAFDPETYDPETFDAYVGRYELEIMPGFVLTFARDGERIYTQATGQPQVDLVPLSDSTFTLRGVDARIVFHRDAAGEVTSLKLFQAGEHRAVRLPDQAAAAPPDLGAFAGRYYSEELETAYTIAVEDGSLVLRHRRLNDIPLTHTRGDTFSGSFPVAEVAFERSEAGQVTGLRAGSGRTRDVWFERQD